MLVLGIETSCDETAVSLVKKNKRKFGGKVINEIVLSQTKEHSVFGGVVPEISSREHIRSLKKITQTILKKSNINVSEIDAFAATCGPGLNGGLLIGSNFAKSLSIGLNKPFFAINHLQAHILVSRVTEKIEFPFLVLLISGGHTQLVIAKAYNSFEIIGETIDDAVGEAFDKTAKILGLGYPGGPEIEVLAKKSKRKNIVLLPRPMIKKKNLDFSFSGLKTAIRRKVEKKTSKDFSIDLAYSFQLAVSDCLIDRCNGGINKFLKEFGKGYFLMAGGVASNKYLRKKIAELCTKKGMTFFAPNPKLCIDNASMIAWTAIERIVNGESGDSIRFLPNPRWSINEL
ncbi:MAG: tRNA (adenosine(37)-N6)-threonylcarbamoyltransferase complex transferase subunit TsaD [Rickettsiales bacterium]|nr:tRNA (adenosine(37)-N6)-threonylcarbamoyltransferase complex transferase subunit TsaD [Rickettsiales bacterium]